MGYPLFAMQCTRCTGTATAALPLLLLKGYKNVNVSNFTVQAWMKMKFLSFSPLIKAESGYEVVHISAQVDTARNTNPTACSIIKILFAAQLLFPLKGLAIRILFWSPLSCYFLLRWDFSFLWWLKMQKVVFLVGWEIKKSSWKTRARKAFAKLGTPPCL